MKIYTEAEVTMLAITALTYECPSKYGKFFDFDNDEFYEHEKLVEFAGRLCYLSFGEGKVDGHKTVQGRTSTAEYLANIIKVKHGSVTEHANFTFLIEGVSRTLTHEFVRHRHFSYSQLSQRYVDESEVGFVVPPELVYEKQMENDELLQAYHEWRGACLDAAVRYTRILKHCKSVGIAVKAARGTARSVLPGCTETKIVVTGNARAWRDWLVLRGSPAADIEIRNLAIKIGSLLKEKSPYLYPDVVVSSESVRVDEGRT